MSINTYDIEYELNGEVNGRPGLNHDISVYKSETFFGNPSLRISVTATYAEWNLTPSEAESEGEMLKYDVERATRRVLRNLGLDCDFTVSVSVYPE